MLQFMINFIHNNIYYIIPLLGIFTISAIYSAKTRSVVLVFVSTILLIGLSFVINRYSTNNENVRSILVSIITLFTDVFHLFVQAFLINVHFMQIMYSAGIYVFFYTMAFSFVIRIVFHAIHFAFVIKGIFKKALILFERISNAFYSYIKNFIINSFLGSFHQVMRI